MQSNSEKELSVVSFPADGIAECQAEYVLPDYLPDVRKIIYTSAELRPAASYRSEEREEHAGIIQHNVIYLDNGGELCSANFSSDYDLSLKLPDAESELCTGLSLQGQSVRATGPRKLQAKCTVSANPIALERVYTECRIEKPEDTECATRVVNFARYARSAELEREYAELLSSLEGAIADEITVIASGAECELDAPVANGGDVTIKGRVKVICLVKEQGEPARVIEKHIPIEETVELEIPSEGAMLNACGFVTSLVTNVRATELGAEIVASVIISLSADAMYNDEANLITDAYMKSSEYDAKYRDLNYSSILWRDKLCEKVCESIPLAEIEPQRIREILLLDAAPRVSAVLSDAGLELHGEVRLSGVASEITEDGGVGYASLKLTIPVDRLIQAPVALGEGRRYDATVTVKNPTAFIDRESLAVECELQIYLTVAENGSLRVLEDISAIEGGETVNSGARIYVYYPDPQETLFDVARKFRTTVAKLATDNSITESVALTDKPSLHGISRLIIF